MSPSGTVLVIAGMHRSGTSMTASLVQALGVDVGRDLMEADDNNQRGYFEDWDFVRLHQAIFREACPPDRAGWPEVGWTELEALDEGKIEGFRAEARALVEGRRGQALWGWKDPRTTLLLPFWDDLLPTARYLFVYRYPWDVVSSQFLTGRGVFRERPDFALRIWAHYNRRLLAFLRAHPGRCALISANALVDDPSRLAGLLGGKLGIPVREDGAASLAGLVDEGLMTALPLDHPLVVLYRSHHPDALALLAELDAQADLPSAFAAAPAPAAPADALAALHYALAVAQDPERDREAAALRREAEAFRAQAEARAHDLQIVRASASWRVTRPLRALAKALRGAGSPPADEDGPGR